MQGDFHGEFLMLRKTRGKERSGLSESNQNLNLGKSGEKGLSRTYEALSGALSSV
jgi:hypothetical protein